MFYYIYDPDQSKWLKSFSHNVETWTSVLGMAIYWHTAAERDAMIDTLKGTPGGSTNPQPDDRPEHP